MTSTFDWLGRVGETWAAEWQLTDRSFGFLTDQLLAKASERPFLQALDVGCGAGEVALAIARGHARAEVIGIDLSDKLIAVCEERSGYLSNVSFMQGDASKWNAPSFAPDLIVSRHGVMFFDDPVGAFRHLAGIAAPHGRLVFSCFRSFSENAWAERIDAMLPPGSTVPPDQFSPGPFSFADKAHVEGLLRDAGWTDISFLPVDYPYVAGAGPDAVEQAVEYFQKIGPAARASAKLTPEERALFLRRLRQYLTANNDDDIIALRAAAWIVSATRG